MSIYSFSNNTDRKNLSVKESYLAPTPMPVDKEVCAYIQEVVTSYPIREKGEETNIAQKREDYNTHCAYFKAAYPSEAQAVICKDISIKAKQGHKLTLRHYTRSENGSQKKSLYNLLNKTDTCKNKTSVLFLHGGGFIVGGIDSHDDICAEFQMLSGVDIYALDYRLAPEYMYPDALHDCRDAFLYLLRSYESIVLVGDSAGGMLAAQLSLMARDEKLGKIKGLVLIYPCLGGNTQQGSYVTMANAPMLTTQDCLRYASYFIGSQDISNDPYFCPLRVKDLSGLPPAALFAAGIDPLCDDAIQYAMRLHNAGIKDIYLRVDQQLVHAYLRARKISRLANVAFHDIAKWIHYYALESVE